MMTYLQTTTSALSLAASKWPYAPAFKRPVLNAHKVVIGYETVTYQEFFEDVSRYAVFWSEKLAQEDVNPGDVVSLCVPGTTYLDLLHVYAILKAGFILHCFSVLPGSADAMRIMIIEAGAKAFVCDEDYLNKAFASVLDFGDITVFKACKIRSPEVGDTNTATIAITPPAPEPEAIYFILHSSGSTEGLPKLIPWTYRQIDALIRDTKLSSESEPECWGWLSWICHLASFARILKCIVSGGCTVEWSSVPWSSNEIKAAVGLAGVQQIAMYSNHISSFIKEAKSGENREIMSCLAGLRAVNLVGGTISEVDLEYLKKERVNLITNYGLTETGGLLRSKGLRLAADEPDYLEEIPSANMRSRYEFLPVPHCYGGEVEFKEMVVPPESQIFPHSSCVDPIDGKFHTGDLFEEVKPGRFLFRGRKVDWIDLEGPAMCHPSFAENEVLRTCSDLVSDCVLIGHQRPSPTLVVELKPHISQILNENDEYKESAVATRSEIFQRLEKSPSYSGMYPFEKLASSRRIILLAPGCLVRTGIKANVNRKAMEEMLKEELDRLYLE